MSSPIEVIDRESAVAFVHWCVETIGLGYHPDTSFADYCDPQGNPIFEPAEAEKLNHLQDAAFEYCDPYEIGAALFEKLMGTSQSGSTAD